MKGPFLMFHLQTHYAKPARRLLCCNLCKRKGESDGRERRHGWTESLDFPHVFNTCQRSATSNTAWMCELI